MTAEQTWPCPECGGPHTVADISADDPGAGHSVACSRRRSEPGTIRDLHTGARIGKTEHLSRHFAEAVTRGGPPCLLVGPELELDRLRPYLPEWAETLVDNDAPRPGIVYAFTMTLEEWLRDG